MIKSVFKTTFVSIALACTEWADNDADMLAKVGSESKSTDCLDKLVRFNYFDSAKEYVDIHYTDNVSEAQSISRMAIASVRKS